MVVLRTLGIHASRLPPTGGSFSGICMTEDSAPERWQKAQLPLREMEGEKANRKTKGRSMKTSLADAVGRPCALSLAAGRPDLRRTGTPEVTDLNRAVVRDDDADS